MRMLAAALAAGACFVVGYLFGVATALDTFVTPTPAAPAAVVEVPVPVPVATPVAAPAKVFPKQQFAREIERAKRAVFSPQERAAYAKAAANIDRAACLRYYADIVGDWYVENGIVQDGKIVPHPRDTGERPDDDTCGVLLQFKAAQGK